MTSNADEWGGNTGADTDAEAGADVNVEGDTDTDTDTDTTPIGLDEVETYLCCPRQYQYAHHQEIDTRTTQDAIDARTARYRDVITATLAEYEGRETPVETLRETASRNRQRVETAADSRSQSAATHRQYDRASVRNAIANYVEEYGQAHAAGAIAVDETYTYSTGGYTFACPVDCCWLADDGSCEIARFVTTLDGIVWANPYSDPVADYRDGEGFYPRQVASILRAYATIHAVAAAHERSVHNVSYRYYAIAEETYPNAADERAGPAVVGASRDVTEPCWEADEACPAVLTEAAVGITGGDWSPTGDRWPEIAANSCRHCSYQSMCLDYINEEVQF